MSRYEQMTKDQLQTEKEHLDRQYQDIKARGLSLNMARGKPSSAQLDLSSDLLKNVGPEDLTAEDGTDARNYGVLAGLPEAKRLMAVLLDDDPENIIVCGNSSLNIMYDTVARCWMFGTLGSTPWCQLPNVKWLCPVPGYDRHFGVTEAFGMELIPVPMDDNGPIMDEIERLAASDDAIKGIWCVPKYSNPSGITYSDDVVKRLASMKTAASDFRIFWDNAYSVHHLYDDPAQQDQLYDIADACKEAGTEDRYFKFASTSKVTFPGAGISAIAASAANIAEIKQRMQPQTIGFDKINQLRHVCFLKDADGIAAHMRKHAALLRPKFQLVQDTLERELSDCGCTWSHPRGGYFVSFNAPEHSAKRIVALCKEAGVTLTGAGATWPHKNDPHDSNIRIAPSLPPIEELQQALEVFVVCVKLAAVEAQLVQ